MTVGRLVLSGLVLALVGVYSCDDDKSPTGGGDDGHAIGVFPSAVGALWKYEVYDSLTETTDTAWVSVTEQRVAVAFLNVCQWRIYSRQTGDVQDQVVNVSAAGVDIVTDTTQGEPEYVERFALPIEDGDLWTGPSQVDTSRVTFCGTVTVPAGTFGNAARVDRSWNPDFEGGGNHSETWLSAEAGIVKRRFLSLVADGGSVTVTQNETWVLIEYDLSTFDLSRFPNTVGTSWTYEVVDTGLNLIDTVTVRIIDRFQMTLPESDSATVWEILGREIADTQFVAVDGSIVTVFPDTLAVMPFYSWSYQFPLAVGRDWGFIYLVPVPLVVDKQPVSVPGGDFPSGYNYVMQGGAFNDYWLLDEWLVPGVGMAKRTFVRFGLGPTERQEWTLLECRYPLQTRQDAWLVP